jgi:hypothetical protein
MSRLFVSPDTADMTIYNDPYASTYKATDYSFRAKFGPSAPTSLLSQNNYICADQSVDFSAFYTNTQNSALNSIYIGSIMLAASALAILF